MNGYVLYLATKGYLLDPDAETFTHEFADAYVFFHSDEVKDVAEYWYGAEVIPVYQEEI
jgi:hypothetical protein